MATIEEKLDAILAKLQELDERLTKIEKSTGRMDGHIGFVESIYDRVREPIVAMLNWNPLGQTLMLPESSINTKELEENRSQSIENEEIE